MNQAQLLIDFFIFYFSQTCTSTHSSVGRHDARVGFTELLHNGCVDAVQLRDGPLTRVHRQLHRADADGDRPVQAAQEPKAEQRPRLLFPLPDPARAQVHPLCQRVAPGPQALQPAHQHHLRPQGQPSLTPHECTYSIRYSTAISCY